MRFLMPMKRRMPKSIVKHHQHINCRKVYLMHRDPEMNQTTRTSEFNSAIPTLPWLVGQKHPGLAQKYLRRVPLTTVPYYKICGEDGPRKLLAKRGCEVTCFSYQGDKMEKPANLKRLPNTKPVALHQMGKVSTITTPYSMITKL